MHTEVVDNNVFVNDYNSDATTNAKVNNISFNRHLHTRVSKFVQRTSTTNYVDNSYFSIFSSKHLSTNDENRHYK